MVPSHNHHPEESTRFKRAKSQRIKNILDIITEGWMMLLVAACCQPYDGARRTKLVILLMISRLVAVVETCVSV